MYKKTLILIGLLSIPLIAQEKINLTNPETKPSNNEYRIERLIIQNDDPNTTNDEGFINIQLIGQNGESLNCVYNSITNPTATFLIIALNKANLSVAYNNNATTGSLRQRIFHRLVVMNESTVICGKTLVGTLAGTVQ